MFKCAEKEPFGFRRASRMKNRIRQQRLPVGLRRCFRAQFLGVLLVPLAALAQAPSAWHDELVDRLAGTWKVTGTIRGQKAHHDLRAEWALNHQFLRIEEQTSADAPADERRYQATWFLGYDSATSKYVLHLMDIYGGSYSETLGRGARLGDEMHFDFPYPDGLFRSTYRWNSQTHGWQWHMEQQDGKGGWTPFADLMVMPASPSH